MYTKNTGFLKIRNYYKELSSTRKDTGFSGPRRAYPIHEESWDSQGQEIY
jgi:hypothetical protein